jgi:hypothetical protein
MADFRRIVRKVYKTTVVYKLDVLLAEEKRWARKATIANTKLRAVRKKINTLAQELAQKTVSVQ